MEVQEPSSSFIFPVKNERVKDDCLNVKKKWIFGYN